MDTWRLAGLEQSDEFGGQHGDIVSAFPQTLHRVKRWFGVSTKEFTIGGLIFVVLFFGYSQPFCAIGLPVALHEGLRRLRDAYGETFFKQCVYWHLPSKLTAKKLPNSAMRTVWG